MQLGKLDHVNIRTGQLGAMVAWYSEVLGMHAGDRPEFPFPGAWLYVGDVVSVHLIGTDEKLLPGSATNLRLEHFAFSATGLNSFESRLKAKDIQYRRSDVPSINLVQCNVWDPDGNHIHIDFPANE